MASVNHRPSYDDLVCLLVEVQAELKATRAELAEARAEIAELRAENAELKRRLAQDSSNSSKPSASDSPFRKPAPRSQRKTSGRRSGGQVGHDGANLEQAADPDHIIEHRPAACGGCGTGLAGGVAAVGFSSSQVFDLPDPRLIVTEHRMFKVRCACGHVTRAADPDGVNAAAQYGPGVHALGVYQLVHQHIPSLRAALGAADLHGAGLSEGFGQVALVRAAARLAPFGERVVALLQSADVAHFDESGIRVAASHHWVPARRWRRPPPGAPGTSHTGSG